MVVSLISLVGCNNYECKVDDFKYTVSVNELNPSVNDSITVTVTLENVSGRNIKM